MKNFSGVQMRGMIVVAFPLLFQLVFICVAAGLLVKLNAEIERELESQDIVRQAFAISRDSITSLAAGNLMRRVDNTNTVPYASARIESMADRAEEFCSRLKERPKQKADAVALSKGLKQLKKIVMVDAQSRASLSDFQKTMYQISLVTLAPRCADRIASIVNVEEKEGKQHLAEAHQSVQKLIWASLIAVAISLVVAVGLGFYYAYSIRLPLKHLSQNGLLLSSRKELLPTLQAQDEFSRLDRLLHTVADNVKTALLREQSIIENAGDMICSIDADGKLCSVNTGGERLLGSPKESLINKKLTELSVPEQFEEAQECLKVSIGSRLAQTFELRLRCQDGSTIDSLWSCLWSQPHQLLFCVVHNISEQKKAERLREDFTEMISQDLRLPLVEIHDSLQMVASGNVGEVSATVAKDVSVADRNVNRLVDLVNDLLDFQRLNTGTTALEVGNYDLVEISRDAAALVQSLVMERGINLILPSGTMVVQCDGKKLMQALLNLISNAIKYSPERGTVAVEILNTGTSVQVLVKDEGPGVPDDFKLAIFEPFQQAPSAKGKVGTGLGLAICKSIAEVHGGSIRVLDGDSGGSVFSLEIPNANANS